MFYSVSVEVYYSSNANTTRHTRPVRAAFCLLQASAHMVDVATSFMMRLSCCQACPALSWVVQAAPTLAQHHRQGCENKRRHCWRVYHAKLGPEQLQHRQHSLFCHWRRWAWQQQLAFSFRWCATQQRQCLHWARTSCVTGLPGLGTGMQLGGGVGGAAAGMVGSDAANDQLPMH